MTVVRNTLPAEVNGVELRNVDRGSMTPTAVRVTLMLRGPDQELLAQLLVSSWWSKRFYLSWDQESSEGKD